MSFVSDGYEPKLWDKITYTSFNKISSIKCGESNLNIFYGVDKQRAVAVQTDKNGTETRYYFSNLYELVDKNGRNTEKCYIFADGKAVAFVEKASDKSESSVFYFHRDHLGSVQSYTDSEGKLVQELSYDAWGNLRNPDTWELYGDDAPELMLDRGYTGHEHLPSFGLINMNARLYNPLLGRFISPDPYVQAPDFTQNFNRFSYCLNNPLKYYDKSGKFAITTAIIVGVVIGAYSGGVLANGSFNPTKWNYSSATTWKYMFCGALTGAFSGGVGAVISNSGVICANTLGIMASSTLNSYGTYCYTGGKTPISISFGAFSYDFTNGEFGYLGKKGNSTLDNIGYGLGAFVNLHDINNMFDSTTANLYTQTSDRGEFDPISHSAIVSKDGETLMSFGPASDGKLPGKLGFSIDVRRSTPLYDTHIGEGVVSKNLPLNAKLFRSQRNFTIKCKIPYQGITSNCVNWSSIGLWLNGIPNIGIHPFLLHGSIAVYNSGLYNVLATTQFANDK